MKSMRLSLASLVTTIIALNACSPTDSKNHRSTVTSTEQASANSTSDASTNTPSAKNSADTTPVDEKITVDQMKTFMAESITLPAPAPSTTAAPTVAAASDSLQPSLSEIKQISFSPDDEAKIIAALEKGFAAKMAAHPGVLTAEQSHDLVLKISDFVRSARLQKTDEAAAKWNTVVATIAAIKQARVKGGLSLAGGWGFFGGYTGGPLLRVGQILGHIIGGTAAAVVGTVAAVAATAAAVVTEVVVPVAATAVAVVAEVAAPVVATAVAVAATAVGTAAGVVGAVAVPVITTAATLLQATLALVPAVLEPVITIGAGAAGAAADIVKLQVDGIFGLVQ